MQGQVRSGQAAGKQWYDARRLHGAPFYVAPLHAFDGGAAEASQNGNLCAKVVFSTGSALGRARISDRCMDWFVRKRQERDESQDQVHR
ncbi:uncharacterized protein PpBr36_05921 [Pyricularia pennisetigena]|uniref:uncharacterized protein n=1 Tax=Pyricularia pennisetigena TaxID=1578925 RepID=UPI00115123D5|nr:uncharacterized protein PpBr36_05921 [Pyricularia pennisetigena]TLS22659.1 hypothetical protein PpBr36_05921 [Pyricularia pennisetigena]